MIQKKLFYTYLLFAFSIGLSRFLSGFLGTINIAIFPSIISELYNQSSVANNTNNSSLNPYNYEKLGILFAAKSMSIFVCSPVMGIIIERFNAESILLFGLVLRGVTLLLFAFGRQYYLLIFARLIEGCSSSSINCSFDSLIAFKCKGQSVMVFLYGIYYLFLFLGLSTGPVVGGSIFESYGRVVPFLLGLAIAGFELFVVIIMVVKGTYRKPKETIFDWVVPLNNGYVILEKEDGDRKENTEDLQCKMENNKKPNNISNCSRLNTIKLFLCDPYIILTLLAQLITNAARMSYIVILPRHMLLQYRVSEFKQGAVYILNIVGYIVGFFVGGFLNVKFKSERYIILIVLSFIYGATIMTIPFMPTWWSVSFPLALVAFQNIIFDILLSSIFTAITDQRHQQKFGITAGLKSMNLSLTSGIASLLAPIIYKNIGFMWLSFILSMLNILMGPLHYFLRTFI